MQVEAYAWLMMSTSSPGRDQMFVDAQILPNTQSVKVFKCQNVWSQNNDWSPNISCLDKAL